MFRHALFCFAAAAALAGGAAAQSLATHSPGGKPLSERIVHYTIEAKYDPKSHTLDATQTLVYRNKTGQALDTFPFHLYLNAFQPQSTFMNEVRRSRAGSGRFTEDWEEKNRGAIEIQRLTVDGIGDVTARLKFIAPDDGNAGDKTVAEVTLPRLIPPGLAVTFRFRFRAKFPEVVARSGHKRDTIFAGQWFPKVGVFWRGAWNCHQYHRNSEFFADFGEYDVKITVPEKFVTGASGVEVASARNPDGTRTVTYRGEDIHDFAWTASPHYEVFDDTFPGSLGPVRMRALMLRPHRGQAQRHLTALRETMKRFERWYGPYPYQQITLVDPEPGAESGGMEYPTLFTVGTAWWMPRGLYLPEVATEHEFGHQYWYGMVATNEFEEAWLDEGINQYVEGKVMGDWLHEPTDLIDFHGATAGDAETFRALFLPSADLDPITRRSWEFVSNGSYGAISYGKTAVVLRTLEGMIGEDKVREALRTWFQRFRFTHPTGEDFLRTVSEVAGRDLRPFFDAAVRGTQVLDYQVRTLTSVPLDDPGGKKRDGKQTLYRNEVVVHRKGDFVFPVEVAVRFDNGETARERWDGVDRWVRYSYDREARVVSAEVDPDHKVWLDRDRFNNSRSRESSHAGHKLAAYWMIFNQWLAQALLWLL